jgi:hypothetical protein
MNDSKLFIPLLLGTNRKDRESEGRKMGFLKNTGT